MKKAIYKITNPLGIHARPAGFLVKQVSSFKCKAIIEKEGKEVDAKRIIGLMSLGVKQGDTITVTFDGEDEDAAAIAVDHLNLFYTYSICLSMTQQVVTFLHFITNSIPFW